MIANLCIWAWLMSMAPAKHPDRSEPAAASAKNIRNRLRDDNCAILKLDKRLMPEFSDYEGADISKADFPVIDSLLALKVREYNLAQKVRFTEDRKETPEIEGIDYFIDLARYKIQLVGLSGSAGERLVYVNCVGRHYEGMWKTRLISMTDGGNSYFHLIVDLERKTVRTFQVNGEA